MNEPAPADAVNVQPRLKWRQPDEWHIRSKGFAVCKMFAGGSLWYVASRWPSGELGAIRLALNASDDERMRAIRELQDVCEAAL